MTRRDAALLQQAIDTVVEQQHFIGQQAALLERQRLLVNRLQRAVANLSADVLLLIDTRGVPATEAMALLEQQWQIQALDEAER